MKVLITGASGLIGRHTRVQLQASGYEIGTFQRSALAGVETAIGDIRTDRQALCEAAEAAARQPVRVREVGCGAVVPHGK